MASQLTVREEKDELTTPCLRGTGTKASHEMEG